MTGSSSVVWGVSALSHDASLAVIADGAVVFAAHAERYSRVKNDPFLHPELIEEALAWGAPDSIAWYERPLLKKLRHLRAGQFREAVTRRDLPSTYLRSIPLLRGRGVDHYVSHHDSHRSAGMATSGFTDAIVITADSIGEFETFSVAHCLKGRDPEVLHRRSYPDSLGLLYSAFTRRCGFRPNEDEYVIMGMASYGEPRHVDSIIDELIEIRPPSFRLKFNPHRGIGDWLPGARVEDLAASIQKVVEDVLVSTAMWARAQSGCDSLIFSGGVALNCVANTRLALEAGFERIWIFPNPGDAGSSFGAAAYALENEVEWVGPYSGTDIAGSYPVDRLLEDLVGGGMTAVANGRAEFGPRALGNRSIFADPRPSDMKSRINSVKGREPFRPFAPVIREEIASELFDMPVKTSPYMQYTATCLEPASFPAIAHVDGTSRVQTVSAEQHPGLHELLLRWENASGCPVLLNTSLNGRSRPLVNSRAHADEFGEERGIAVW